MVVERRRGISRWITPGCHCIDDQGMQRTLGLRIRRGLRDVGESGYVVLEYRTVDVERVSQASDDYD